MFANGMTYFFSNFSLCMLLLALFISLIHIFSTPIKPAESLYRWIALFPLGFTGIYTFIIHAFFPLISAANIGWAPSPFQYEVAIADLTIGVLGILSFRASLGFRKATVIAAFCWLWGDAVGHIRQMVVSHNFAPGNAGSWFWLDIIVPLLLLLALIRLHSDT